jgi:hypothetical protein
MPTAWYQARDDDPKEGCWNLGTCMDTASTVSREMRFFMYDTTLAHGVVDYYMEMKSGLYSTPQLCAPARQLPISSTFSWSWHDFFQQDGSQTHWSESSSPKTLFGADLPILDIQGNLNYSYKQASMNTAHNIDSNDFQEVFGFVVTKLHVTLNMEGPLSHTFTRTVELTTRINEISQ